MKLNEQIFETLKGFGYVVTMYDKEGKGPIANSNLAEYASAKFTDQADNDIMIRLPIQDTTVYPKLVIYKSKKSNDLFIKLLKTLKNIAISYGITVTIREFGKNITPKDMGYLAKATKEETNQIKESLKFDRMGTTKSSYHINPQNKLGKIIIRHSKKVNETTNNSRSRNIKALFVETKTGERRLIETKSLLAAKALVNHINCGGELFDSVADKILNLSNDINVVKKLKKQFALTENNFSLSCNINLNNLCTFALEILKQCTTKKIEEILNNYDFLPEELNQSFDFYKTKLGDNFNESVSRLALLKLKTSK